MLSMPMLRMILFASYLAVSPSEARAERPIAVARVIGPKRALPRSLESGILHALKEAGLGTVDADDLAQMESAGTELMAARDLDAEALVTVSIVKEKRALRATATLIAIDDGVVHWQAFRTYSRTGAWKAGRALGAMIAGEVKTLREPPPPPAPPAPPAVTSPAPIDPLERHPEDRIFHASLSGGSQLSSEYAVSVKQRATGLAYRLRPTALIAGELSINLPWLPLSLEASIAYVPMFYDIDVEPAVTPDRPGARHLDVAGSIGYGFRVWIFAVRPLLGLTYRSLAVQQQQPIDIIIGSTSIAPHLGLRAAIRIGAVTMEAKGLFRLIAMYRESPHRTGDGSLGYSVLAGAAARYWITDFVGAYAEVAYDFTRIGFDGAGTRVKFEGDPELVEATVFAAEIRAALGVTFAL
jgi:hypothetical protein